MIEKLYEKYDQYKDVIIEVFIKHYGEDYRNIIEERINNVCLFLYSKPEDDLLFMQANPSKVPFEEREIIRRTNDDYIAVKEEERKFYRKVLMNFIRNELHISGLENIKEGYKFFADDSFNESNVDGFSSKSLSLLDNPDIPESIKKCIVIDQNIFRSILKLHDIPIDSFTPEVVDKIINFRNVVQYKYQVSSFTNSLYGKRMLDDMRKRSSRTLHDTRGLTALTLIPNSWAGYISYMQDKKNDYISIARIPYTYLHNHRSRAFDIEIIHELIHVVERDGNKVGIKNDGDQNSTIVNEIRTQNLALKLLKEIREAGIFIFDDPNEYTDEGESTYEVMFPLTKEFFDRYETIISDCAINNDVQRLYNIFGESWKDFYVAVEKTYYKNQNYNIPIEDDGYIKGLIDNMVAYER